MGKMLQFNIRKGKIKKERGNYSKTNYAHSISLLYFPLTPLINAYAKLRINLEYEFWPVRQVQPCSLPFWDRMFFAISKLCTVLFL